ncbi:MAG TPA: SCO family protein [Solirubrobacteraceae bacterium]|nr:SCO family protein [Solirubrobacteraceae bacterium]
MDRVRHGPRAALALVLILAGATIGVLAAGRDGGADAQPAPGLRANLLPAALDGAAAPRIALRDQHGRRVDSTRLARPYLVTFLYTHCVDVCPLIGSEIADGLDQLGRRADDVAVLAVSVDPRGDTPAAARAWVAKRRLPRQFHYLLGAEPRLRPIWRDWYVIGAAGGLADPRTHDASVWLVDRRGRLRGRWSGGEPIAPEDIAHDLQVLVDEDHQPAATRPSASA